MDKTDAGRSTRFACVNFYWALTALHGESRHSIRVAAISVTHAGLTSQPPVIRRANGQGRAATAATSTGLGVLISAGLWVRLRLWPMTAATLALREPAVQPP